MSVANPTTTSLLVESAHFLSSDTVKPDEPQLLAYLRNRYSGARITVTHREHGVIPLGFAPSVSLGQRHILLGTKRGLVKPSAGYGILSIESSASQLAKLWSSHLPLPPTRQYRQPWRFMDSTFLRMLNDNPAAAQSLMQASMDRLSLRDSLHMLDEELPLPKLSAFMMSCLPSVTAYITSGQAS